MTVYTLKIFLLVIILGVLLSVCAIKHLQTVAAENRKPDIGFGYTELK